MCDFFIYFKDIWLIQSEMLGLYSGHFYVIMFLMNFSTSH